MLLWPTPAWRARLKPVYLMMVHVYRQIFSFGRYGYAANPLV
jgi:hypothetical protein